MHAQFGHAVDFRDAFAREEVEPVEILRVLLDHEPVPGLGYRQDRFEQGAFALLNVLSHRVQVGRVGYARGEDAPALLAFAFAVELFPPLVEVLQFRLVGAEDFDFPPFGVEPVAHGGVDGGGVLGEGDAGCRGALHGLCAADQLRDVDACRRERQQPHGGQHRVASADVVGDDERGVAFVRCEGFQCTARLVRDGYDPLGGLLPAVASFDLGFQQPEGDGRFGRGARFGDHDRCDRILGEGIEQFAGVIFRNVLSGEEEDRPALFAAEQPERVAQGFEQRFRAEVGAADADADDRLGLRAEFRRRGFEGRELLRRDRRRQTDPAQKIASRPLLRVEQFVGFRCLLLHVGREFCARFRNVQFDGLLHNLTNFNLVFFLISVSM